ncbi:hypothetical protein [Azomonas macrocytogenes]|uniref:Glycerophosphotransferase n=1 Tax=Azomonas macrocytogenes TaxID=69962 RepID=A0A839T1Y2_AZOMA|nr:hypothetical protein [Azomonas macrocytogenes]MBB3102969.1 hypothetical protein [Azomonas macrocytogenes]
MPASLNNWSLMLPVTALLYLLIVIVAQFCGVMLAAMPPLEISSDLLRSLGLAFAVFQLVSRWSNLLVRRQWLMGCAGMLLIWCAETAVDTLDYRGFFFIFLIILAWVLATVLLFRCLLLYLSHYPIETLLWVGVVAQVVMSLAWIGNGLLDGLQSSLQAVIDSCSMTALLAYSLAMVLARLSRMDVHATCHNRLQRWAKATDPVRVPVRICFPFIAQVHQIFHSLPIAVALAQRYPDMEVHLAGFAQNLRFARRLIEERVGPVPLHYDHLYRPWSAWIRNRDRLVGSKKRVLRANQLYFSGFDALVTPERTSLYLREICPSSLKLIGTKHGAGDRAVAYAPELAFFDFLLLPGNKEASRLLELGYTAPGRFAAGIYAKLDWITLQHGNRPRLFDNDRPTVLYNPHFEQELSSWPLVGRQVLDYFAQSTGYNLIFAPHIRMFDPPTPEKYAALCEYQRYPHMLIDLGSDRCVDMTYTLAADIYIGDVSSQVVEFVTRPRPCIFLNPRNVAWQDDVHYRFWNLGPVVTDIADLDKVIDEAVRHYQDFEQRQRDYLQATLGLIEPGQSGARGADAIVGFLRQIGAGEIESRQDTQQRRA